MMKAISLLCTAIACLLLTTCLSEVNNEGKPKIVALQPIGNFPKELIDTINTAIKKTYKPTTYILNPRPIPAEAFVNTKTPRYRADILIQQLKDEKPDSIDYIIGLTIQDISTTKHDPDGKIKQPESKYTDWGIMGLGYQPGPSCVVSTFRLNPSSDKFFERLKKVALHELGHNRGLKHCKSGGCVMQDAAETIKTIDTIKPELCSSCIILLHMKG